MAGRTASKSINNSAEQTVPFISYLALHVIIREMLVASAVRRDRVASLRPDRHRCSCVHRLQPQLAEHLVIFIRRGVGCGQKSFPSENGVGSGEKAEQDRLTRHLLASGSKPH